MYGLVLLPSDTLMVGLEYPLVAVELCEVGDLLDAPPLKPDELEELPAGALVVDLLEAPPLNPEEDEVELDEPEELAAGAPVVVLLEAPPLKLEEPEGELDVELDVVALLPL